MKLIFYKYEIKKGFKLLKYTELFRLIKSGYIK